MQKSSNAEGLSVDLVLHVCSKDTCVLQVRVTHGASELPSKTRSALRVFASKALAILGVTLATLAYEDDIARSSIRARRFKACIGAWPNTRTTQKAARRSFLAYWQRPEIVSEDLCQCCQTMEEDAVDEISDEVIIA